MVSALSSHNGPGPRAKRSLGQPSGSRRKQAGLMPPRWLSSGRTAPMGTPGSSRSPGESRGRRGRGSRAERKGPLRPPPQGQAENPVLRARRPRPHGASALTSTVLGGGHPPLSCSLSGHQENRSGLCTFSSKALKESRIRHLIFFFGGGGCWPLRPFSAV